jgi:hypothetical protein
MAEANKRDGHAAVPFAGAASTARPTIERMISFF